MRAQGGVAINPEDGARYGAPVSKWDPPDVARCLRAHRNAEATIYPFLLLGLRSRGGWRWYCRSNFCNLRCRPDSTFDRLPESHPTLANRCFCRLGPRDPRPDDRRTLRFTE